MFRYQQARKAADLHTHPTAPEALGVLTLARGSLVLEVFDVGDQTYVIACIRPPSVMEIARTQRHNQGDPLHPNVCLEPILLLECCCQ